MSDFAQTGLITTLQRLNDWHFEALETELLELSHSIALVLPCHASELERPALESIVQELSGAKWLAQVVVSMNGPDPSARLRAESLFGRLPQRVRVLWNADRGGEVEANATGKGHNVAVAIRLIDDEAEIIATQDCDVASFRRQDLARLCYAVAHPELGFQFAKAYYSRATDRLYGRVTRLFLNPLLHACVRVAGHQPLLSFLLSFRYPLAGEIAMKQELAKHLPIARGWSLELGTLCEVFRQLDPSEVCQVDGGGGYDHKHQPAAAVVTGMAGEIAAELFRQLEREFSGGQEFRRHVAATYLREAEQAVRRSAGLARMNGLPFDQNAELELVAAFSGRLREIANLERSS